MNANHPSAHDWMSLVDKALPSPHADYLRLHLGECKPCRQTHLDIQHIIEVAASPMPGVRALDPNAVMRRARIAAAEQKPSSWAKILKVGLPTSLATAVALILVVTWTRGSEQTGIWSARGHSSAKTISQRTSIRVSVLEDSPKPIGRGMRISKRARFMVSYRNIEREQALYLLSFAVDAQGETHWLYPENRSRSEDPVAYALTPATSETVLPQVIEFEDVPEGPLRFISIVSSRPLHVSDIEHLRTDQMRANKMRQMWPNASVEELTVDVVP